MIYPLDLLKKRCNIGIVRESLGNYFTAGTVGIRFTMENKKMAKKKAAKKKTAKKKTAKKKAKK